MTPAALAGAGGVVGGPTNHANRSGAAAGRKTNVERWDPVGGTYLIVWRVVIVVANVVILAVALQPLFARVSTTSLIVHEPGTPLLSCNPLSTVHSRRGLHWSRTYTQRVESVGSAAQKRSSTILKLCLQGTVVVNSTTVVVNGNHHATEAHRAQQNYAGAEGSQAREWERLQAVPFSERAATTGCAMYAAACMGSQEGAVDQQPQMGDCARTAVPSTYDIPSTLSTGNFLASVDTGIVAAMCAWVSVAYSIFLLPNGAQQNEIRWDSSLSLFWGRWWLTHTGLITAFVGAWNLAGLCLVYWTQDLLNVPVATVRLCTSTIVTTAGVLVLWIYIGSRTRSIVFGDLKADNHPKKTRAASLVYHRVQYWVQFMRLNEASLVAPSLLVATMCTLRDYHDLVNVQTTFVCLSSAFTLLVAQDIFAAMFGELWAYNILLPDAVSDASSSSSGDNRNRKQKGAVPELLLSVLGKENAHQMISDSVHVTSRITAMVLVVGAWGLFVYYSAMSPIVQSAWDTNLVPPELGLLSHVAPLYPVTLVLLNLTRCVFRV